MEENKKMTPEQSIHIIQDAIKNARREEGDAAYYTFLWGILLFFFFILTFVCLSHPEFNKGIIRSIAWLVFPVGGVLSYLHARKTDKKQTMKPLNDEIYKYVWGGVGLSLGIWTIAASTHGWSDIIPVLVLLFGLASFITGSIEKVVLSVVCGILAIICAAIAHNLKEPYPYLWGAVGMLLSNIIPGGIALLKRKEVNV